MIGSHKTVITGGTAGGPVVAMGGIDASNGGRGGGGHKNITRPREGGLGKFNSDVTKNPPVTGPLSKFDRPQIQIFI